MDTTLLWLFSMKNPADVRTIAICASKWAVLAAVWTLYPVWGACGRCLGLFLQCVVSFLVMTMVHNAMHCDVFVCPNVEFVWRILLSMTAGVPVEAYRPTHNLNHHVYTQQEKDHLNTSQMKYRWHFLNLVLFFPQVYPSISRLEGEYLRREAKKWSSVFVLYLLQYAACHGSTFILLCLDWRRALFCWILPYIAGADMIITMNMLQHDGCEEIELGKHKGPDMNINSSRNFVGPVINFFTCNNGYHSIHHMMSATHWTEYPELHQKFVEPHLDPSLNEKCIVRYLWRTFVWPGRLPEWRREPNA